jgi:excisionase family DNA binding protein
MNLEVELPVDDLVAAVREVVREELRRQRGPQGFLDVRGAADFLSISEDALRTLQQRERIPFHRSPGGRILFDRVELDAWVKGSLD